MSVLVLLDRSSDVRGFFLSQPNVSTIEATVHRQTLVLVLCALYTCSTALLLPELDCSTSPSGVTAGEATPDQSLDLGLKVAV